MTKENKKENKKERFIRIAEARTNKIINMLKLLGNCSNKTSYEYTDKDVQKIFSVIEKEMKNSKNKFLGISNKEEKFSLR